MKRKLHAILGIGLVLLALSCCVPTVEKTKAPALSPRATGTRTMYFCGIDPCRDSGEYGRLAHPRIIVWNHPDPNRGGVRREAKHQEQVIVTRELRVYDGPGGLWYELKLGGWTNDLWLTDAPCTPDNLPHYSFTDCLMGKY